MKRHFYIADDATELKIISMELQEKGISKPQIHLVSKKQGAEHLDSLHPLNLYFSASFFQLFFTRLIFVIMTLAIVGVAFLLGLTLIAVLLISIPAIILFLYVYKSFVAKSIFNRKMNNTTADQSSLKKEIEKGRYILLIELGDSQESQLDWVKKHHPEIEYAGFHSFKL